MLFAFDLWSYSDVSANADSILEQLRSGAMPCDGAWPPERVELIHRWVDTGKRATVADPVLTPPTRKEHVGGSVASVQDIQGRLRSVVDLRSQQLVGSLVEPLLTQHPNVNGRLSDVHTLYAHFGAVAEASGGATGDELHVLALVAQWVLTANVLVDLGFAKDQVKELVQRNEHFKWLA